MNGTPSTPDAQPPSTNRGVLRPDDRECGGVDYLKLTVWASVDEVCENLSRGVLDRYGWSVDPFNPEQEWVEKVAGGRTSRVLDSGSICVIEYREEVTRNSEFCSVEVKGAGCDHLGNEGVRLLLNDLDHMHRVRASRVDVMAHTVCFSPQTVRDAVHAGEYCSRAVKPEQMVFIESANGNTCYLGMASKPAGGLKRSGDRVLRVYDRRGPTRVELQLSREHAHGAAPHLLDTPLTDWPGLIRGFMRDYCDFIDASADKRPTRCPLLPWWAGFVEHAEKISVRPQTLPFDGTPIGIVDGTIQRYAGRLFAAQEAFGEDWINRRISRHGKQRQTKVDDHADLVAELEHYIGTGLAGVPEPEEEVPF